MTGKHQDKAAYIRAVMDGTLNYYSEKTDSLDSKVAMELFRNAKE